CRRPASGPGLVRNGGSPAQAAASPRARFPRWRCLGSIRGRGWGCVARVVISRGSWRRAAGLDASLVTARAFALAPPGLLAGGCAAAPGRAAAAGRLAEVLDLLRAEAGSGAIFGGENTGRASGDTERAQRALGVGG